MIRPRSVVFEYSVNLSHEELMVVKDRICKICPHCKCVKPPKSHHCRQCNMCIVRMDHHCPWIGNCVGYNNQKAFLLFLLYVLALSLMHLSSFIWNGVACWILEAETPPRECRFDFSEKSLLAANYGSLVVALFFAFFTFVMLAD